MHVKLFQTADESAAKFLNSFARPSGRIDNKVSVTTLTGVDEFDPAVSIVKRQGQHLNVIILSESFADIRIASVAFNENDFSVLVLCKEISESHAEETFTDPAFTTANEIKNHHLETLHELQVIRIRRQLEECAVLRYRICIVVIRC